MVQGRADVYKSFGRWKGDDGYVKLGDMEPGWFLGVPGPNPGGYGLRLPIPGIGLKGTKPGGRLLSGSTMVILSSPGLLESWYNPSPESCGSLEGGSGTARIALSGVRSTGSTVVLSENLEESCVDYNSESATGISLQ